MDYRQMFAWPSGVFPVEHDLNGAQLRQYDVDWKQRWDVYGTGIDNGCLVPVSVGVITPPGATMVVINAFDDGYECMPIALTPRAVEELRTILQRALEKRAEIEEIHRSEERTAAHHLLDRAVLTAEEWKSVLEALRGSDERLRAKVARAVQACAPPAWAGSEEQEGDHDQP